MTDIPRRTSDNMGKHTITCRHAVRKDNDMSKPGTTQRLAIDPEEILAKDKRADVSFPPPVQDPMDWLSPLATQEAMPQEGALYKVPPENPHEQSNPRFGKVTYLIDYPYAPQAEAIMRKVALLVRPIMDEHKWTVPHLTEFYATPEQEGDLGLNVGRGEVIFVCLREADDKSVFMEFEEILSTVLHELVHNWYDDHDGDFGALLYDLSVRFGASIGCTIRLIEEANRPIQHPKGHISIFLSGARIFLSEEAYRKHFSIWAQRHREQDERDLQSGRQLNPFRSLYINLPYDDSDFCVLARLIQVARGLDPAINKTIHDVPNYKDFSTGHFHDVNEEGKVAFVDWHIAPEEEIKWAFNMYLDMFRVGSQCGMHVSTKEWLIEQITHIFSWGPQVDGDQWHKVFRLAPKSFYDGISWTFPSDPKASSRFLGEAACKIYAELPMPEGQCLRDMVVARMKELAANSVQAARYYDLEVLLQNLQMNGDLMSHLNAMVS